VQTSIASQSFTRSLDRSPVAVKAAAVVIGALAIAAAAQVEVPMVPVSMTMQTLAVLAVGLLYGGRLGATTVLAYLAMGAVGLPVFAGGANLAVLLAKPFTVGYLAGFVVAAGVAGGIATGGGLGRAVVAVVAGTAAIYAFGLSWLAFMLGGDWTAAVTAGALPFLVGDGLKAVLAVAVREGIGRLRFGPA
jgi:biotin transport system substrate-specific component